MSGSSTGGGASTASPVARIEQLKQIEQDVVGILESAGQALKEMSKEKLGQKAVDTHNNQVMHVLTFFPPLPAICKLFFQIFQVMANIRSVDTKLSEQIKYLTQVSTGHPHEGSSYPSQKVLQVRKPSL